MVEFVITKKVTRGIYFSENILNIQIPTNLKTFSASHVLQNSKASDKGMHLEKEMATHSSILAWRIPWTEEPGRLQSMVLQKVGQDLVTK